MFNGGNLMKSVCLASIWSAKTETIKNFLDSFVIALTQKIRHILQFFFDKAGKRQLSSSKM